MWIRIRHRFVLATSLAVLVASCGVSTPRYRTQLREFSRDNHPLVAVDEGEPLFAEAAALDLAALTRVVLARNPSIERARQGWRAALAQYDTSTALPDPTLTVTVAPLSFFDSDVKIGVGAQLVQPLPYPGKRKLRGEVVLAEADAARADMAAVRQRLALMTATLYYDYYAAERALDINGEHIELLDEYGDVIVRYLETGRAFQDDALQVDVERAQLRSQRVALESNRDVVVAQLNALLHREPALSLPAPPADLAEPDPEARTADALVADALRHRPELSAVAARERGASSAVALAERDYYPDMAVMGTYNRMWPMLSHQIMVGLSITLPTARSARRAREDVASAKVARARAERDELADRVRKEVHTARRRVTEADDTVALYRDRVLPAARDRVVAIRVGLDAGRTTFLEVLRAERALRTARLSYFAAVADAYRRRAELAWAVGDAAAEGGAR